MQCIMKRMVTIAMNQTNSGNTLTNGYHQSMFNTIIVVLLLGFCAVVATLHSLLTFYGSNTMARKNMMPLKNAKRQRWHVQRRRKPKESSSTVCVQLYYKKESTWYVYELKDTCVHGVHTYQMQVLYNLYIYIIINFFFLFLFFYMYFNDVFDTSGETVHYYIHVCTYIFYSSTLTTNTSSLLFVKATHVPS